MRYSVHLIDKLTGLLQHSVEMLKLMALNIYVLATLLHLHTAELRRRGGRRSVTATTTRMTMRPTDQ